MNSLPTATSPRPADDTEVFSQRLLERGEVALEAPQGGIPDIGHAGFKIPADRVDESHGQPGSQPHTILEPSMVPNSAGDPSLGRASRLHLGLLVRPRCRIACWKRFAALP